MRTIRFCVWVLMGLSGTWCVACDQSEQAPADAGVDAEPCHPVTIDPDSVRRHPFGSTLIYSALLVEDVFGAGPDLVVFRGIAANVPPYQTAEPLAVTLAPNVLDPWTARDELRLASGTFEQRGDAVLTLDVGFRDVVLHLTEPPVSLAVPAGACVALADADLFYRAVPPDWTCSSDRWDDGACDCACGAPDLQCFTGGRDTFDDCASDEVCFEGSCLGLCNVVERVRCDEGEVCAAVGLNLCFAADTPFIDAAAVGAPCSREGSPCGVVDGFATGTCSTGQNPVCRADHSDP